MDRLDNLTFKHYAPVGRCIYCGSTENLTDEHIIPYAIAGTIVLHDASCLACASKTGSFEQKCCRLMFDRFRRFYGLPSRKGKKDRPHVTFTHVTADGSVKNTSIPTGEHPVGLVLPVFQTPRILLGLPEFETQTVQIQLWRCGPPLEKFKEAAAKYGSRAVAVDFDLVSFGRLIAKIGHAYATAVLGVDGFSPLLPDLIIGRTLNWSHYVGAYGRNIPITTSDQEIHVMALDPVTVDGDIYLACMVRLFSRFGAPAYACAVGRLNSSQLERVADFVKGHEHR
jgi:hypothetical protein